MSRAEIIAQARAADRERERLVSLGVRGVAGIERRIRVAALNAYRRGGNVPAAVALEIDGITPVLVDAMTAAHLRGRLTALTTAAEVIGPKSLGLASPYDGAMQFLEARLGLSDSAVASISREYGSAAASVTGTLQGHIDSKVGAAVQEAIRLGVPTRKGAQMIRDAFDAAGITPANSFTAEAIFRTQAQIAYSAGRWQANQAPEIQDQLFGYEYVATMDDRTTELCERLDGTRRRKEDPFWQRFTPPNHWSCRSTLIEIWKGDAEAKSTRVPRGLPDPDDGFDFNPGDFFPDVLAA